MPCPAGRVVEEGGEKYSYFWPSYYISRFNFVAVHLFTVFYWFPFLFNNPLHFPFVNTLDAKVVLPPGKCTTLDTTALRNDILLWALVWWLPHSLLSRRVVKQALGLYNHQLDRPLFGTIACLCLPTFIHFWRPISNCSKLDIFAVNPVVLVFSGTIISLALTLVLAFFWLMPDHVFGTARYRQLVNPPHPKLFVRFPYGIVRHPAAAGFLWMFWALPSWNPNHLLYATLWTIFIVVGTHFEEGGLRGDKGEFGTTYAKYASQVGMFFPRLGWFVGKEIKL